MAVDAADALAVRREHGRRPGEPRRCPLAEHRRQGVRVGVRPPDRSSSPMAPPSGPRSGCAKHPAHATPLGRAVSRTVPSPPAHTAPTIAPGRKWPALSPACASCLGRGGSPAAPRTTPVASVTPGASTSPASRDRTTPGGPPGPPNVPAHPHVVGARTSPWAPCAGPCRCRCGVRSPWCGPPAASSRRRRHRRGNATGPRRSRPTPTDAHAPPPSPRSSAAGCTPAPARPGSWSPPLPAGSKTACCCRSGASAGTAPTGASPASDPAVRT